MKPARTSCGRASRARVTRTLLALGVVAALAGCTPAGGTATAGTTARSSSSTTNARVTRSGSSTATSSSSAEGGEQFSVKIEPGAGYGWYVDQLAAARRSVDVWMYELTDRDVIAALVAAHDRGVAVRVILDAAFHGRDVNQGAYDHLHDAGVAVRWAPDGVIFHIKATIVDGALLDVATGNLVPKYYADDRDATVLDRNPGQVRAAAATFSADWAGGDPEGDTVSAPGLVWSPGATGALVAFITSARHSGLQF